MTDQNLTDKEKVIVMRSVFNDHADKSTPKNLVKSVGDFISNNFSKIDGFDYRWTSLITNNPLLFEDLDYLRVKPFIDNQINEDEIEAYKRGDLTELYGSFENMLVCNLKYYDRIMSFCTMIFLHYVRINNEVNNKNLDKVPHHLSMTPTQIWCAALSSTKSTSWEIKYGWNKLNSKTLKNPIDISDKSFLEVNWNILYKDETFSRFMEYSAARVNSSGFRQTFINDKTSNRKLSQVCSKFTKSSIAISDQQLETIYDLYKETETVKEPLFLIIEKCLKVMFNGDKSQYGIYIFTDEFYVITSKFQFKVSKSATGQIMKDYLANNYECFVAEEFLVQSTRNQIQWAKYEQPINFKYDKSILKSLLVNMLTKDFRNIICLKRMNEYGILTKVHFKGVFANVTIVEEFMFDNRVIKTLTKTLSKKNAANYLVERGYILFGVEEDVFNFTGKITKKKLITHYMNYCIPVIKHMQDVIITHQISKNDIIDFVTSDTINPVKFNNHNIKETEIRQDVDSKDILKDVQQFNKHNLTNKKSYWKAVED